MNPDNYASLEASKRLVDKGIVLETDYFWRIWPEYGSGNNGGSEIVTKEEMEFNKHGDDIGDGRDIDGVLYYPAPSMAEVWRELPETALQPCRDTTTGYCHEYLSLQKDGDLTVAGYGEYSEIGRNSNPTDALINLLIWQRKEGI